MNAGNQVVFEAARESFHVVSRTEPEGEDFKFLGVDFDCKLEPNRFDSADCMVFLPRA